MTGPVYEYTADGWMVIHRELFSYLMDHSPPRPSRLWRQLLIDVRCRPPQIMWVFGSGLIALGIYSHWWILTTFGIMVFLLYSRLMLRHVGTMRDQVIERGVIDSLKPHPLFATHALADAHIPNGNIIPVVLDRNLVKDILTEGQPVEVVFTYGRKSQYGGVIGARRTTPNDVKVTHP